VTTALTDTFIVPDWRVPPNVRAYCSTRLGGVSEGVMGTFNLGTHVGDVPANVAGNRALLRTCLPNEPVWMDQVHDADVIDAAAAPANPRADGAVTRSPGIVLCVMTADCLPVLLADSRGNAVGIAHAGWRGLTRGVIEATINRMQVPPAQIVAYLGPAISRNAYEVGAELLDLFVQQDATNAGAFVSKGNGKYWCDLYSLAMRRLIRQGVSAIYGGGFCTHTDVERFFSFRRDGQTGRMASFIWLTQ
jgi:polyphenol oxidase